jgi:hypothetical protein
VLFILEEILPHFGADFFHDETEMRGDWVIAQNGMAWVEQIAEPKRTERSGNHKAKTCPETGGEQQRQAEAQRQRKRQRQADEAGRKGKAQASDHGGTLLIDVQHKPVPRQITRNAALAV